MMTRPHYESGRTPDHTFAAGWNARCDGVGFDKGETAAWQEGWDAADEVPAADRWQFNSEENFARRKKPSFAEFKQAGAGE